MQIHEPHGPKNVKNGNKNIPSNAPRNGCSETVDHIKELPSILSSMVSKNIQIGEQRLLSTWNSPNRFYV
ncbi:hypothetical protein B5X24_HaOG216405 [Helicoverpa armigera]|nr:hypothetical protein B5X24_HaOG216405 [Helicoverpa armigera]